MLNISKLTREDWIFIVLFDLAVFYIGYTIGKDTLTKDKV